MALNFPTNTSQPYIDNNSGLKYIFNKSIGAWETAIQPPAVITEGVVPNVQIPGFLWWDSVDGSLYIYYDDGDSKQWVEAVPSPDVPRAYISDKPNPNAIAGDMWWDTVSGRLFIYYDDQSGNPPQWIDASPNLAGSYFGGIEGTTSLSDLLDVDVVTTRPTTGQVLMWNGNKWVPASISPSVFSRGGSSLTTYLKPLIFDKNTNRVSIIPSTTDKFGVVKLSTQEEVNRGVEEYSVLTPSRLKKTLNSNNNPYLPVSSEKKKGIVQLASSQEVLDGKNNTKAVTPQTLKEVLQRGINTFSNRSSATSSDLNPVGTVINYAGSSPPPGYFICDGRELKRSAYSKLFSVIGISYGQGDGVTTFRLPRVNASPFISCIKY